MLSIQFHNEAYMCDDHTLFAITIAMEPKCLQNRMDKNRLDRACAATADADAAT